MPQRCGDRQRVFLQLLSGDSGGFFLIPLSDAVNLEDRQRGSAETSENISKKDDT
jgi:hypothetical protein